MHCETAEIRAWMQARYIGASVAHRRRGQDLALNAHGHPQRGRLPAYDPADEAQVAVAEQEVRGCRLNVVALQVFLGLLAKQRQTRQPQTRPSRSTR